MNFPLDIHPRAHKAAEAGLCAARQGRFWEMHDSLFANPKALGHDTLTARASSLGLNEVVFARCLDDEETAELVERELEEGKRLGVMGTPAFFLGLRRDDGGIDLRVRIRGAVAFSEFEKAIHGLLSEQAAG